MDSTTGGCGSYQKESAHPARTETPHPSPLPRRRVRGAKPKVSGKQVRHSFALAVFGDVEGTLLDVEYALWTDAHHGQNRRISDIGWSIIGRSGFNASHQAGSPAWWLAPG